MGSILAGIFLGFLSAAFHDLLKLLRDNRERDHERKMLELKMQHAAVLPAALPLSISADNTTRHEEPAAAPVDALLSTSSTAASNGGWVETLNGTVRPMVAYGFFGLYACGKLLPLLVEMPCVRWSDEDHAIFASILSFYFGQRAMSKVRAG